MNITNTSVDKNKFTLRRVVLLLAKTAVLIIIAIKLWFWPLVIATVLVLILASLWVGLGDKIELYKKEMGQLFDHAVQQWNKLDKIKLDPEDIYHDKDDLYRERAQASMPLVRKLHAAKLKKDRFQESRGQRRLLKSHSDATK